MESFNVSGNGLRRISFCYSRAKASHVSKISIKIVHNRRSADLTVLIIDQKFVSLPLSYSEHCVQFQPVDCWLEETFLPLNQNKSMELAGELKRNKISRVIYAGQWHRPACAIYKFKDAPWPNSQVSFEDLVQIFLLCGECCHDLINLSNNCSKQGGGTEEEKDTIDLSHSKQP